MRFLWAFRYNPSRRPAAARPRECFAFTGPLLGVVSRLRRVKSKAPALRL
ncbi:MAG: hypothetical protein LBK44_07530 [Spirochaetales bacterium]|nr:hypothetical protein [Spirochaetales bacterium]